MKKLFISSIIVAREESKALAQYVTELQNILEKNYEDYEIIVVENLERPADNSAAKELVARIPCLRVIRLAQTYKHDTAVFAGLEAAIGDYVCVLDINLDPISELLALVEANQSSEIVQGVSRLPIQSGFGGRTGRKLFYWYNRKYIGLNIPLDATYLTSFSRKAVNALTSTSRNHRHLRHLIQQIGLPVKLYEYQPTNRPDSQKSLRTGIIEAIEIASSYSTHPLRFVAWLGVFAGTSNAIYAVYVVLVRIFKRDVAEGWTTTSLQLSLMFFFLFGILVILSEYIGRILTESRQDARYIIVDEMTSPTTIASSNKRNIAS